MYTDPGVLSLIIAFIVGIGLTPIYLFRTKILGWFKRKKVEPKVETPYKVEGKE